MRKNQAVALAIVMSWAAASVHADGECTGGASIDSAGNECMRDVAPVMVMPAPRAPQLRPEVKPLSFAQTVSVADEKKKSTQPAVTAVARAAAHEPVAEPNRC